MPQGPLYHQNCAPQSPLTPKLCPTEPPYTQNCAPRPFIPPKLCPKTLFSPTNVPQRGILLHRGRGSTAHAQTSPCYSIGAFHKMCPKALYTTKMSTANAKMSTTKPKMSTTNSKMSTTSAKMSTKRNSPT